MVGRKGWIGTLFRNVKVCIKKTCGPGCVPQVGGSIDLHTKRLWVQSQSGHIPRLRVRSPVGEHTGGNQSTSPSHVAFSVSLPTSL